MATTSEEHSGCESQGTRPVTQDEGPMFPGTPSERLTGGIRKEISGLPGVTLGEPFSVSLRFRPARLARSSSDRGELIDVLEWVDISNPHPQIPGNLMVGVYGVAMSILSKGDSDPLVENELHSAVRDALRTSVREELESRGLDTDKGSVDTGMRRLDDCGAQKTVFVIVKHATGLHLAFPDDGEKRRLRGRSPEAGFGDTRTKLTTGGGKRS